MSNNKNNFILFAQDKNNSLIFSIDFRSKLLEGSSKRTTGVSCNIALVKDINWH